MGYESFLHNGIGTRVKFVRNHTYNKKTKKKLIQSELFKSQPSRISHIENFKVFPGYASIITFRVIYEIFNVIDSEDVITDESFLYKKGYREFWLIFGEDKQLLEFLEYVYRDLCFRSHKVRMLTSRNEDDNIDIDLSLIGDIIWKTFFSRTSFSLAFGKYIIHNYNEHLLSIEDYNDIENMQIIEYNEELTNSIEDAISFTWSLISDKVLNLFKTSFKDNDKIYNTGKIDGEVKNWCKNELKHFLINVKTDLEIQNSISSIGFDVYDLMKKLLNHHMRDEQSYNRFSEYENGHFFVEASYKYIQECAEQLAKLQTNFIEKHKTIAEEDVMIDEEMNDYSDLSESYHSL